MDGVILRPRIILMCEAVWTVVQLFYKQHQWTEEERGRSEGIAPGLPNFGTRWKWVVGLTPRQLYYQGNIRPKLTELEAFWAFWRRKNRFPLPGFDPRIVQPVAMLTAVYRLWLCTVRVKIYRSSVTSAGVNIVISTLWKNRLFQHSEEHLGFYTPIGPPLPDNTGSTRTPQR